MGPDFDLLDYLQQQLIDVPIHLSAGAYLALALGILAMWSMALVTAQMTRLRFSASQVEIKEEIGEGAQVFDVTNLSLEIQKNVSLRHSGLGLGCMSDLIFRVGGAFARYLDWPNVDLGRNRWKIEEIKKLLAKKPVTPARLALAQATP